MRIWRDIRFAIRELKKSPGYTAAAIFTLSFAIAANASIFGAVNAVLLGPNTIDRHDDLVIAWDSEPKQRQPTGEVTYRQFLEWAKSRSVRQVAAMSSSHWPRVLDGRSEPVRLALTAVSESFFRTLGTQPALGRAFDQDDDSETSGRVAILSHQTWNTLFGADPKVVGTTINLGGPVTIVGIMPETFDFPQGTDLWMPVVPILKALSAEWKTNVPENVRVLHVLARMSPGVNIEEVRTDFDRIAKNMPGPDAKTRDAVVTPFLEIVLGPVRSGLWWLLASVGVLLLVGCANLAGIALTRAVAHRRDDAVRLALGATRGDLTRRWLLEAVVLAIASALVGLALSSGVTEAIRALAPDDIPGVANIGLDLPVAVFTLILGAVVALLCGIAPALAVRSTYIGEALSESARGIVGHRSRRLRAALVTGQICLALVTLIVASLVVRSFTNLRQLDLGFQPDGVVTMQVAPRSSPDEARWFQDLSERLEQLPGVERAGAVFLRPLAYGAVGNDMTTWVRGQPETIETALRNPRLNFQTATPGYFRAMRIPLLAGRAFETRDRHDQPPVVIVGESTARALWPGEDPIGKQISIPSRRTVEGVVWQTVVGVVKDVHYRGLGDVRLDIYEPVAQTERMPEFIVVRTSEPGLSTVTNVQRVIREMDTRAVIGGIATLESIVDREVAPLRLISWVLSLCAGFTLALALLGLVAQLSLDLAQRSRELALRLAVGAEPRQLRRQVIRRAALHSSAGVFFGLVIAAFVTQLMRTMLFGVEPVDVPTWAIVTGGTFALVLAISSAVTQRMTDIDPIVVLRGE